jgi:hypothetical protein
MSQTTAQLVAMASDLHWWLPIAPPTPTSPPTAPGGPGDLFKGLAPNWGPFAKLGAEARTVVQVIMAAVLMVCLGTAFIGAGKIRFGQSEYSHDPIAIRDGRKLVYGGALGAFLVASMGTIFTIVYGMGI